MNEQGASWMSGGRVRVALICLPIAMGQANAAPGASGRLEIVAAVVSADLSVRPVPKYRFQIIAEGAPADSPPAAEVLTGFDGKGALDLPEGRYRVVSAQPLLWEGAEHGWDVAIEIRAGQTLVLELSNERSQKTPGPSPRASRLSEEARLFQKVRGAVFLIEADAGHGSGFLVDPAGLILTNYHVAGSARYLAAKVNPRRKVRAQVLALDREHDITVIRVHPDAVKGVEPLKLAAAAAAEPLVEGERVLAIGSPLTQEWVLTTGVASKIESDAIISDVNINPGNSGGPLLNLDGEVVGINTFGVASPAGGPGVSGIVRIHLAEKALAEARGKAGALDPPRPDLLPVAPERPYPAAALRDLITSDPDVSAYHVEAGKINVEFLTPPLLHSLAKRAELRAAEQQEKRRKGRGEGAYDPKDDFFEWRRHAGNYEPVVIIQAIPETRMTGGSWAGLIFGAAVGVVPPVRFRFKTDFREMQLLRGGKVVEPIVPGRACQVVSAAGGMLVLEDVGCYGIYKYAPEVFEPGPPLELRVANEDRPDDPKVVVLDPVLVGRVWDDFKPYFAASPGAAAQTAPAAPAPPSGAPAEPAVPGEPAGSAEPAAPPL